MEVMKAVTEDLSEVTTRIVQPVTPVKVLVILHVRSYATNDAQEQDEVTGEMEPEHIILDRLQVQLHAQASDQKTTYTMDPDPEDTLAELELDKRQEGETMSYHKALQTEDVLKLIFSFLDVDSLDSVGKTCSLWKYCVVEYQLWEKLAKGLAAGSEDDFIVLNQKGLNASFNDNVQHLEKSEHFQNLCKRFTNFKRNWKTIEPKESFLYCDATSFAVDDKYLLCGVTDDGGATALQVWNLDTRDCVTNLEADNSIMCVDLLGDVAVSGYWEEVVIDVWNIKSGRCKSLDPGYSTTRALKLYDSFLLSGHSDGRLIVWLVKSMDEIIPLSTIVNHTGTVRGLDISDKFVVTCSWNNTVAVYSHSNIFPKLSQVNQASQDISIPGHLSYRLEGQGHNDGVYCVSLCDDTVVTGSRDRSVRVWLLGPTEYTLLRVLGHSGWERDVTQDQDRVYSCDRNGEVLVWNKKMIKNSSDHSEEEILVRKLDDDRDTRGDVNCIKIMGSKMLTSLSIYDDCGYIAIKDFW